MPAIAGQTARKRAMNDPRRKGSDDLPDTPTVDDRANEAFLDTLFDTDGRPNRDAESIVEIEGIDEDEDDAI
jgi:hypothetical protein